MRRSTTRGRAVAVRPTTGARIAGGVLALVFLSACATTAEYRRLERDVRGMRATGAGTHSAAGDVADLSVRLDEIEERLKEIQGYLEQVDHRTKRALDEAQAARTDASESRGDADTARRDAAEATRLVEQLRNDVTAARAATAQASETPTPVVALRTEPAPEAARPPVAPAP